VTTSKFLVLPSGELVLKAVQVYNGRTYSLSRLDTATNRWLPFADSEFTAPSSGATFDSLVKDVSVLPNGDVVVCGSFQFINGVPFSKVARWDGAAWHDMSAGLSTVPDQVRPDGLGGLMAVGSFSLAPDPGFSPLAFWHSDSNSWAPASRPSFNPGAAQGVPLDSGDVLLSGSNIAQFYLYRRATDEWKLLDSVLVFGKPLMRLPDGGVLAMGSYRPLGAQPSYRFARWDPQTSTWSPLAGAIGGNSTSLSSNPLAFSAAALPDGRVIAGGSFDTIGSRVCKNIAIYDGVEWRATNKGVDGPVTNLLALPDGDVIVAGIFKTAGDVPTPGIVRWRPDSNEWFAMPGITNWGSDPYRSFALAREVNGDILFSGPLRFPVNSTSGYAIVRWDRDAQVWQSVGIADSPALALLPLPNGDIIAGGAFNLIDGRSLPSIARWRASTGQWERMSGFIGGPVYTLALSTTGEIYAGGSFTSATGSPSAKYIARWDEVASTWQPVDPLIHGSVRTLTQLPGDRLLVQGSFVSPVSEPLRYIAVLFLPTLTWQPVTVAPEDQVAVYHTLCLGTTLPDARAATAPSHWTSENIPLFALDTHSGAWTRFSGPEGTAPGFYTSTGIQAMTTTPAGDLIIGGRFTTADGQPTFCLARLVSRPPCSSDFDCSGQVAVGDLVSFLSAWFGQYGIADGALSADFNKDLYVGVDDLFAYIDAWMSQFAQCP
jgi:hypothetical protein